METSCLEQQLGLDQQLHLKHIAIKKNQLKAMTMAQESSKRRLQQAKATINDFLANPIAGTFDEAAKNAKIQEITKQVEMDRMFKVIMVSRWMIREANKDKELGDLRSKVKKLKDELVKKQIQLQTRILPPSMDATPAEPIYFEPLEKGLPSSSAQASKDTDELNIDYTVTGPWDPRETNIKKELKQKIQVEVDDITRSCMEWELKILHSTCIHYLTAEAIHTDYHMPTLPYPLLKQEV